MQESLSSTLSALPWYAWIAIVAIVTGAFSGMIKMLVRHSERMAMIRQGMHPDAPGAKPHEHGREL